MPTNRTLPLKDSAEGYETEFDSNADAADVRGVFLQNDTSDDATVLITRDASDNLTFKDPVTGFTYTLAQLAAGGSGLTPGQHQALRQLIHFIDNGPANGFASGAYRENTGTVFPTAIIWYDDNTKVKKLVEKLITYTGSFPTTIQWKMYDVDGSTVLATVTDAITYSGPFEANRTRTIA